MAEIERALEECCRAVPTGRPAYKWTARSSALWSSAVFLCNLCFLFSQTIHPITIHFAPSLLLKLSGASRSAILCQRFQLSFGRSGTVSDGPVSGAKRGEGEQTEAAST